MTLLLIDDPGAILPGWLMAQMLSMAAGQECHPVALIVLTKIKQQRCLFPFVRAWFAFGRGLG
jgi:hypothetical protein